MSKDIATYMIIVYMHNFSIQIYLWYLECAAFSGVVILKYDGG